METVKLTSDEMDHDQTDIDLGIGGANCNNESTSDEIQSRREENVEDPKVGMSFSSLDNAVQYYQEYGNQKGFAVVKASGAKGITGERKYQTLKCYRSGKCKTSTNVNLQPRPTNRIGCEARMCVTMGDDRRWRVTKVVLEHTHTLSPGKSHLIAQHRLKTRRQLHDMAGIRPFTGFHAIVHDARGYESISCCLTRDSGNLIKKNLNVRLDEGDAKAIYDMFVRMQEGSRDFFYAIDPDSEGRLKNVFWADVRSRAAYQEFGDVVTFDTSYLVKRYNMPFAPFVGVNHHGQSILFGCALILDEEAGTFNWVFRTWLRCMRNRHPKAIITDHCDRITNAIQEMMPQTRHRFCLWHILQKLPEKLKAYSSYDVLSKTFVQTVHDSLTVEDFERSWKDMVSTYNLVDNEWIPSLYEVREKWVPVFVKETFWAGMSSTERSEGMNAYFDGYVNSMTTLKQFVRQYEIALKDKIEKENELDFRCSTSIIPCVTMFPFEKQFQEAYTHKIFSQVQKELTGVMYCEADIINEGDNLVEYKVLEMSQTSYNSLGRKQFIVVFKTVTGEVNCSCRLFEFKGILCRHAFRIIVKRDVHVIHEKYVLRRWRKDVARWHSKVAISYPMISGDIEMRRIREMEGLFYDVVGMAAKSADRCEFVQRKIKEMAIVLESWTSKANKSGQVDDFHGQDGKIDEGYENNESHAIEGCEGQNLLNPNVGKLKAVHEIG